MSDLTTTLYDITDLFESLGVRYAVMGGIAVRIYGIPRPTHDVDFTIAIERDQLSEFFRRATDMGYTVPAVYESGWVDRVAGMPLVKLRIYLEAHGVDVDIFLAESPFQESLLSRRRYEEYEHRSLHFVSPEDLILLKLIAGRPRDLVDVVDVLFVQGQLDEDYLQHWASVLQVSDRLDQVLAESRS